MRDEIETYKDALKRISRLHSGCCYTDWSKTSAGMLDEANAIAKNALDQFPPQVHITGLDQTEHEMKHDHKLDTSIDAVTEYIAVSAGVIDITDGIVDLYKDIDAAENILIILLRVKATLNKIEADASNGGPAESIRDLLDTMP